MKFRARFIANIIQFAAQQGVSRNKLIALTGHTAEELQQEELLLEARIYNAVVEKTVELTGDSLFGIHLGEYLSLSAAGLIVQIAQSSQTVLEALHYMVAFANLGCQSLPAKLTEKQDCWELSFHPNSLWEQQSPQAVRHTMDGMLVFTIREFHTLTHQKYYPTHIHLSYPRPKNALEYERVMNCRIRFNQPVTAIYLDKKQVVESVVTSDYRLLQILVQYAEQKLRALQVDAGFVSIVKQSILNLVQPQFPPIEQVAANLNISVRTLQRRLSEEGATYKVVIEDIRKQFAKDYLKNQQLSIKEIAYLLDYSEASAFNRSFKRWTGMSPKAFRLQTKTPKRNV